MRTKTLLLTAALSAAGVATSMAQAVYSVNAVGYVNTPLVAGYNLVSNPLNAADNTVATLFEATPDGTQVFVFENGAFQSALKDFGAFEPPSVATKEILPGQGVFVRVNDPITITFVGEVSQGDLSNELVAGLSIEASEVPQAGTAEELGLPATDGDQLFKWLEDEQRYESYLFDFGEWSPASPQIDVGEAFFLRRSADGSWDRTFNINE